MIETITLISPWMRTNQNEAAQGRATAGDWAGQTTGIARRSKSDGAA